MDRKRKLELLEAWKNRCPEMGVISFQCSATAGNCPNKRLQELWEQYGEDAFELQVIKRLEYDDPTENHQEELETLCELCLLENPNARRFWK